MAPNDKFKKMNALQSADAIGLLRTHFTVGANKIGYYAEGWSDERVAIEIGAGARFKGSISNLRVMHFAKLQTAYSRVIDDTDLTALRSIVEKLQSDNEALLRWATDPALQRNPLVLE